jgi:hypothetical protein
MGVPTRLRERLRVELGGMRLDWNRWCARRGMTSAEGVRQLIAVALGADANPDAGETGVEGEVQWTSIGEPRRRIEIRLTHTELETVEQRAAAFGMTRNRWMVALIRAQLKREPQLGVQEMRLLSDSNQQLAVISQRLGQLAREGRALRMEPNESNQIGIIRDQIDVHLRAVAAVIRTNLDRWSQ